MVRWVLAAVVACSGVVAAACTPLPSPQGCRFPPAAGEAVVIDDSQHPRVIESTLHGVARWNEAGHEGPRFVGQNRPIQLRASHREENSLVIGWGGGPCGPNGSPVRTIDFNVHQRHANLPAATRIWVGSHEIGHALGLDHLVPGQPPIDPSQCPFSVMWWSSQIATICGVTGPGGGDVVAINEIYD